MNRGRQRSALLLSSMAVLEFQRTVGLPAALLHSDIVSHCMVLEAVLQQPCDKIFIWPEVTHVDVMRSCIMSTCKHQFLKVSLSS